MIGPQAQSGSQHSSLPSPRGSGLASGPMANAMSMSLPDFPSPTHGNSLRKSSKGETEMSTTSNAASGSHIPFLAPPISAIVSFVMYPCFVRQDRLHRNLTYIISFSFRNHPIQLDLIFSISQRPGPHSRPRLGQYLSSLSISLSESFSIPETDH